MPRVVLAIRARPKGVSLKPAVSRSPEPLRLEFPGRDRFQCHHQVVQAPGAREADGVGRLEHRGGAAQRGARGARRDEGQILPRRDTGPAPEQAVEVKFRQARGGGDRREARLRAEVAVDVADRARDAVEIAAVEETAGTVVHGSHSRARGAGGPTRFLRCWQRRGARRPSVTLPRDARSVGHRCGQRATITPMPTETTSRATRVSPIRTRRIAPS